MTSRPRCDSRRKRRGRDTRARDRSALRATQPCAGLGIPHVPVARDSKPPVESCGFARLVLLPPGLSFSAAPSGGVSGLSSAESRDSWAPYMAVATAAPARGLGRAGGPIVLARGSGARKCTQTINFPPASPPGAALGGQGLLAAAASPRLAPHLGW